MLKAKKIAQDELNASLAEQASVLETDTLELRKLETAVANGATYEEAFASSIKNASTAAKEHAIQTKGASGSTDVFVSKQRSAQASLRATATASKTASVAMRALSMAMNMIVIGLITKGLELLGSAISNYIHRVEKANEKIEESRSSYEDAKSSIESMNDELKTTQDKIDDLKSKGTLSFTDKAELDNLKAQNDELERSISLEEKKKQNAASQTVNDIKQNKDTLSDDFEESIKNLSEYQEEYEHMKQVGIKGISDETVTPENYEVTMTAMDKNMDLYEKHVLENIEKFEKYKEDIINKYNTDDVSQFSQSDRDLYNSIVSQLQKAYKTIYSDSDYNKFVIEPIFNQDKLKGLQDQLLQYFVNGGSTDTSALEEKFGADIITALRNACEKAGIDFDKMIEDMYSNSQSKLNQIAPMIETPNGAEDAKQNQVSKKIRDYIQNDLSEEDRTILLNAEIPDDVKFKTKQDVDNFIDSLNKEANETTISFADINKTKSGIGGLFDKYEQNEGYLTQDEVASVLETNPEYIQYLVKVGDQYKLNEQALNDWNEANKEQKQEINNQMGGNDYLSNYSQLLDSIQNNASHPNGGVGNTNIGSQLDDLINKNKEWNTSLQNGEITTAQYFQNISNAITNSGLEDALHSLNGKFDDSTDYIEETVSVLATQLSDGLAQSTKRFEEGQTSVQDYIEEINAGSDAEKKLLASTYDLNISQETGKASLDGLSGSALEAAQSYNSLVDSQNALASTSGFVDVLSQNAEFLSQYTDEAGNLMDSIFDDSRFNDYISNMSNSIVDFANQNTTTMGDVASWLAETAGISTEQATSIIAQGGEAVQEAVSGSLNGVQSMTSFAMSQVGTAAGNAASAVGSVLSSLGKMISSFSYKITATPFIKGKSKFDWNPKTGLDVSLPTFGFDIKGSGGKSVQSFSTSLGKAGEALNKYGASQNASAAFNNINSYKPKKTLSANKPSSYRPTYKPKSSGKSGGGSKSPSGGGSGSEKEPTKKDYDWIETLISRINRQVSNLGKTVSATYKTWSTRNNALAQELGSVNQQISAEQQAYNKYMQLANSVGLPEGYASLVRNGTIDVSTIQDDDLNDKIEKYKSYYESALSAADAVQDLQDKLAELAKTKFDNISSDFEAQIDQIKHSTAMYQSYIDQVEAEDAIPVRSYYESMIANEQQTIGRLKDEYSQLTNAMNEALNTGRIQAYSEEWYNMRASINSVQEAIQDANKSIIEYTKSMKELSKTKFNKISTAYENASGFNDHAKNMYNGLIDQADAEGRFASKDYYSALMDMEKLNIKTLTQESNDLHKSLQEAMNKGDIEEYSDDWYEMMEKINDVDEAIMDANKSLTEYGNSMRQLDWDLFDKQEEYISKIQEESDFLVDLMSKQTLYDKDTGKDTKYATAIKGLHAVNYNAYMAQSDDYAKEIQEIDKEMAKDPYNTDLLERRQELLKAQQDAISNAEKEKQSIKSLVEEGIKAQLDALQKLIDKYKEALNSKKDLYDYQKSINEKTSNIASIQKQINAYGGDNSEETQSKVQQLQQNLKEAKSDLEDTEYQQYLSDQEQLLDTFYNETEEWLNSRLDDLDGLIQQVIEETNTNAGNISQTIQDESQKVGYTITDQMKTIWNSSDGFTAVVSNYCNGFQNTATATLNSINLIKGYVENLSKKADAEAAEKARQAELARQQAAQKAAQAAATTQQQQASTSSSGGSSSGGGGSWGSWFVHKADSYPKNRLDIQRSITDRLKYHNIDSSFSRRRDYYYAMGGSGTYTGSSSQNRWMISQLAAHGYAHGTKSATRGIHLVGEDANEIGISQGRLVDFSGGETVFNGDMTSKLWDFAKDPTSFLQNLSPVMPKVLNNNITSTVDVGGVNIVMNGVNDVETFSKQLRQSLADDVRTQKMVKTFIYKDNNEYKKYR